MSESTAGQEAGAPGGTSKTLRTNHSEDLVRVRIALAAAAVVVAGGAGIASAAPPPLPVSVTHDSRGVCVTISYQLPHCVPVQVSH